MTWPPRHAIIGTLFCGCFIGVAGISMAETELDLLKKEVAALTEKVAELKAELLAVVTALEQHRDTTTPQIAQLRYDLDFMAKESMRVNDDTTDHLTTIYRSLGEYMYPAFNKLFPDYEVVKGQIEKIIGPAEELIDPTAPPKNP